jgi:cystathionine beta-lyase
MFDFDQEIERRRTGSAKWNKYAGSDIIPMWVADMDFQSPPSVLHALNKRIAHGVFGYAEPDRELTDTVLDYLQTQYNWTVRPDWIVWLPGLVCGLNVVCRSTGSPGSCIMTCTPAYPPFLSAPKLSGRNLLTVPMRYENNRWAMDLEGVQTNQSPGCDLFILCNPHNPTGRVFDTRELDQLARICLENKMVICSDEIHCDLVLEPGLRHIPLASLSDEIADSTITLMAPSKTYNVPGLSCSFAVISNPSLRRRFKQTMQGIVPHVNALGFTAAQAAFAGGRQWLEALRDYLRGNRDLVFETINELSGLHMAPVQATYLAWIDTRPLGLDDPVAFFENAGIGLSDGKEFGMPGFVRLNFGCTRRRLNQALDRMKAALTALRKEASI